MICSGLILCRWGCTTRQVGLWQCFSKYMVQDGNLIQLSAFEQLTYLPSLSANQVFVAIICFASALSGWYDQIVFSHYYGFCFQGEELVSQHITITRQRELLTYFLMPTVRPISWLFVLQKMSQEIENNDALHRDHIFYIIRTLC